MSKPGRQSKSYASFWRRRSETLLGGNGRSSRNNSGVDLVVIGDRMRQYQVWTKRGDQRNEWEMREKEIETSDEAKDIRASLERDGYEAFITFSTKDRPNFYHNLNGRY